MPILSVLIVLTACLSFSVCAEDVNYRTYEVNSVTEGDYDIVTLEFDPSSVYFYAYRKNAVQPGYEGYWAGYGSVTVPMYKNPYHPELDGENNSYAFRIYPGYGDNIFTANIPAGVEVSIKCELALSGFDPSPYEDWFVDNWPYIQSSIRYFDKDGNALGQHFTDDSPYDFDSNVVPSLSLPFANYNGQYTFSIRSQLDQFPCFNDAFLKGIDVTLSCKSYIVTLRIPTSFRNDDSNKVWQDQIMNGTPEQNEAANNAAGVLGDKGEQLGNLAGDIQPEKPNLDSVNTNVGDLVPSTGVNTLTSAISPIANNDLVIKVLVMVATLILVSYVLFGKKG